MSGPGRDALDNAPGSSAPAAGHTSDAARARDDAATIPELVRAAAADGARLAISDGATQLTFAQLAAAVEQAARGWLALGIAHGDRIAIWAPNGWGWEVAALGAQSVGAILVPLNTRWKGREAADVLARSRARALVSVVGFLGIDYPALLRAADVPLPELRHIVILDGPATDGALDWASFVARGAAASPDEAARRARAVAPDDLSDLIFTAGTTGQPKGVACTHGQALRTFRTWSSVVGLEAGDRYLVVNPYFHTFGYKAGWLSCLITGATCLPQAQFDVAAVLERIQRERVTVMPGPPTLYHGILNHPERAKYDLSSLRLAVTGAATIPVELIRRMREELTIGTILTAYGLTESCGVVSMCRRGDDVETIALTSGRAIPDVEVRVVDDGGVERPRGEPGEIVVRGYNVMRGYWEDAEATRAAIDADGWLHTGDVGVMDAGGNVRITDRIKDMFIVGGFNVYPAEIENALMRHPEVAQAAVVGVPDGRLGEVGHAFVLLRPGGTVTGEALATWARAEMANYKVPRTVEIVREFPLNAVGKVLKYQLRERAAAGRV